MIARNTSVFSTDRAMYAPRQTLAIPSEPWRQEAACAGHPNPDLWFSANQDDRQKALDICQSCPVWALCKQAGRKEPYGIWGGRSRRAPVDVVVARRQRYDWGWSDARIAEAENNTAARIGTWRRSIGLPSNHQNAHLTPETVEQRERWVEMGWSDRQIGEAEGISHASIWRWRRRRENRAAATG